MLWVWQYLSLWWPHFKKSNPEDRVFFSVDENLIDWAFQRSNARKVCSALKKVYVLKKWKKANVLKKWKKVYRKFMFWKGVFSLRTCLRITLTEYLKLFSIFCSARKKVYVLKKWIYFKDLLTNNTWQNIWGCFGGHVFREIFTQLVLTPCL